MTSKLKQEYFAFFRAEYTKKMAVIGYEEWLEQQVLDLRADRKELYDIAWEQHLAWMQSLINLAVEQGFSAEDSSSAMTSAERELNRKFAFYMVDHRKPEGNNNATA